MGAASNYRAIARRYRTLPEQVVRAGGAELQKSVLIQLKRDTGGDRKLRNFTRNPNRRHQPMGVTVKVFGGINYSEAEIWPSPFKFLGMWSILEFGAKAHFVGELKRKDKSIGPGGKHMKITGDWKTGPTHKPSFSPARNTYTEGIRLGLAAAERAMADVWENANG